MSINIVCHNSQGLKNDCLILKNKLKDKYEVNVSIYEEYKYFKIKKIKYDKQIFIEHIFPHLLNNSKCNIFIPNLEFINESDYKLMKSNAIKYVIAKNNFSYKSLFKHLGNKVVKWFWTSIDRNIKNITPDFNQYLHVKGKSKLKNSQMILDIWTDHPEWPMLHIVHYGDININGFLQIKNPLLINDNITLYQYKLDENTLNNLMNRCGNHICPSETEGYGHYINEARSVGAVVLTTNSEPMNEFTSKDYGFLVNVKSVKQINMGVFCLIEQSDLENTIQKCINTSWDNKLIQSQIGKRLYKDTVYNFNNEKI